MVFLTCYQQQGTGKSLIFKLLRDHGRGNFEFFLPRMVTCCTDWGEIWQTGANFPPSVQRWGYGTPKTESFHLGFRT